MTGKHQLPNINKEKIENKVVSKSKEESSVKSGSLPIRSSQFQQGESVFMDNSKTSQRCEQESNSSTSEITDKISNGISLKENGFKLGKEAFRQTPTVRQAKLKDEVYFDKLERDPGQHKPTENVTAANHYDRHLKHENKCPPYNLVNPHFTSNKMESNEVSESINEEEKTIEGNVANPSHSFAGKGPVGFDAAFQQFYHSGMGPGPRFGQPLGIPPRFPGPRYPGPQLPPFGNSMPFPMRQIGKNANLEPITPRNPPKNPDDTDLTQDSATTTDEKANSNAPENCSDQPSNEKKSGALPSLLDIQVKLPPPSSNAANMSSDPLQSNVEDENNIRSKDFTPTLRTSVTFGSQGRSGPQMGSFNTGPLNKPYGFDKGPPNAFARPPHPQWFTRPNFIRPGSNDGMPVPYGNQGQRFNNPVNFPARTQGYGNFQSHASPLNPVIYNEAGESTVGQLKTSPYLPSEKGATGVHNSQPTNGSLNSNQPNNLKRPSFDSVEADENGTPYKKMSVGDNDQNSSYTHAYATAASQNNCKNDQDLKNKDENSVYQRVRKVVTPLWNMPINVQLEKKNGAFIEFLGHLKTGLITTNQALTMWFQHQEARSKNGLYVENKQILASPLANGYRNKCDFVIGINPETKITNVGFLIEQGTSFVGPVGHLNHISEGMKYVALELEKYCQASEIPPFDLSSGSGHWMGATIRQSKFGEIMLNVAFHPQDLNKLQLKSVKEKLRAYFTSGPGQMCRINSLFFTIRKQWESGETENIYGVSTITEELCGKRFQISSRTFFAINTSAAELMYNTISEMVHLNLNCTLVDICCGTGSIGLSLSDRCGQVLGIDILEDAINDANKNALDNNITNCEFMIGSVEESLPNLWRRVAFSEAICIVDPPRAGIGSKAIQSIRKNSSVSKVVYVASDPQSAVKNFLDFARPPSNTFKGEPFVPVRAVPVDLFPHTTNFCIVFLFMRVKMADLLCPENVDIDSYLRGADEKPNSRGGFREVLSNQQVAKNSSIFPEHSESSGPPPDLTWKKVQTTQSTSTGPNQNREELLSELSQEQIDWLDQMVQIYGSAFQREEWIESFKAQNAEASANYLASIGQSQSHPTPVNENTNMAMQSHPSTVAGTTKPANDATNQANYDSNVAVQMYAPGAATGWYAQQPPTTEISPTPTNNAQANSISTTAQAASSGWANYSQQYAQYNQSWNQQQAQQPTPSANPQEPQPPTGGQNESNTEGWNAYRQLMSQYWANWSSSSNNESSTEEANAGVTSSNQSQPPLPLTNHLSLPKDTSLS